METLLELVLSRTVALPDFEYYPVGAPFQFGDLPLDVQRYIFTFLIRIKSLLSILPCVCKHWKTLFYGYMMATQQRMKLDRELLCDRLGTFIVRCVNPRRGSTYPHTDIIFEFQWKNERIHIGWCNFVKQLVGDGGKIIKSEAHTETDAGRKDIQSFLLRNLESMVTITIREKLCNCHPLKYLRSKLYTGESTLSMLTQRELEDLFLNDTEFYKRVRRLYFS